MLASDRPTRGGIGQDDQIQPLERLRRYAAAPTGPDAGAALLGRARFRRRQRRVRTRRLSGAGMAAMASPRHDGDVGDASTLEEIGESEWRRVLGRTVRRHFGDSRPLWGGLESGDESPVRRNPGHPKAIYGYVVGSRRTRTATFRGG